MGINQQARADFSAIFAAFKAATSPTRAQRRKYVAAIVDADNELLQKLDKQNTESAQAFADSKPSQYTAFVDALPDVTLDPVDPNA